MIPPEEQLLRSHRGPSFFDWCVIHPTVDRRVVTPLRMPEVVHHREVSLIDFKERGPSAPFFRLAVEETIDGPVCPITVCCVAVIGAGPHELIHVVASVQIFLGEKFLFHQEDGFRRGPAGERDRLPDEVLELGRSLHGHPADDHFREEIDIAAVGSIGRLHSDHRPRQSRALPRYRRLQSHRHICQKIDRV